MRSGLGPTTWPSTRLSWPSSCVSSLAPTVLAAAVVGSQKTSTTQPMSCGLTGNVQALLPVDAAVPVPQSWVAFCPLATTATWQSTCSTCLSCCVNDTTCGTGLRVKLSSTDCVGAKVTCLDDGW